MRLPACFLSCLFLTGCAQPGQPAHSYRATIASVSLSEWQHYTLQQGYGVQHEVVIEIRPGGQRFKLLLFDIYSPEVFGDARDEITFLYAGRLPTDGQLGLDRLKGYRIERRMP
jgi:hypothetical protein